MSKKQIQNKSNSQSSNNNSSAIADLAQAANTPISAMFESAVSNDESLYVNVRKGGHELQASYQPNKNGKNETSLTIRTPRKGGTK